METIEYLQGLWRLPDDDGDAIQRLRMLEDSVSCSPLGDVPNEY